MQERVQKLISNSGIVSRRKAEILISQSRVRVNGEIAYLGQKADIQNDIISIDKYIIPKLIEHKLFLINKPSGFISSCLDEYKRKTVIELIPYEYRKGMYPIGRLDKQSRGALLISNIGILALHLTHPKYQHRKTYHVWINGIPTEKTIEAWRRGVDIEGKKTKSAEVEVLRVKRDMTLLKIILLEGRNRQIRKVADKFGHQVIDLKRTEIANIKLNSLKEGCWREITQDEWQPLLK